VSRTGFAFATLLALGALDATGYGVMAPVAPELARETDAGPGVIGALVTCFALGQLVGYPLFGELQRRRGATRVLTVALVLIAVGDAAFLAGGGLAVYFPARALQGIGAGGMWIGVVFGMMERFPGEEYRRVTALLGAYSLGGVAGPALGAVGGIRGPFAVHLGLVVAAGAALAVLRLPSDKGELGSDRGVLRSRGFLLACAGVALVALALGTLEGPLPLHFGTRLSQGEIGLLFVFTAVLVLVATVLAGRARPQPMLALSLVLLPAGIAVAGATDGVWLWVIAVSITAVGFGAGQAGALGLLLAAVGVARIVLAMVVWSLAWGTGYLAGPAVSGAVAETLGFGAVWIVPAVAAAATVGVWLARSR
jgi:MFS family permease